MNKKILISLSVIAAVSAIIVGATIAYESDVEKTEGVTFSVGTIDIAVDGENPWKTKYSFEFDKPCETNWIEFEIENVGTNPAKVWKHIANVESDGGLEAYECKVKDCPSVWVSSEPECEEGTANYTKCYEERSNLAAYMIYDMETCEYDEEQGEEWCDNPPEHWVTIIPESHQVRVDNVSCSWIYLGTLASNERLKVRQSYHLMSWEDAAEPIITNWVQGDKMTFDIELEAQQLTGPGPVGATGILAMDNKDPITWEPIADGISGTLTYNTSGPTFQYTFSGTGLQNISYSLIYYADPWPGNHPGALIGSGTASGGNLSLSGSPELSMNLPAPGDANYPAGAKIWLVPSSDYDAGSKALTAWNPTQYLFEMNLISYNDI